MGFVADCTAKPFEESKANANFIATAYEACRSINPSSPLAVAEAMPEAVNALRGIAHEAQPGAAAEAILRTIARAALAKLERTE
jgi:hypothetical protein